MALTDKICISKKKIKQKLFQATFCSLKFYHDVLTGHSFGCIPRAPHVYPNTDEITKQKYELYEVLHLVSLSSRFCILPVLSSIGAVL